MKLSDMLFSNSKYISFGNADGQTVTMDAERQQRLSQELGRLKPGQTLQGEIISKNGNEVQIKLNDDLILTAHLDKNMDIEPGRIVTFEVKNNVGTTLALSPLFENMGTDANVLKALDMAGLPVNKTTVGMTNAMMQAGMSIDRNSLTDMFKQVMNNPESRPASVVMLNKMGVDITPQNLQQLENYKNLEHQIIKDMTSVLDELPLQYDKMMASGDTNGATMLYQAVLDLVTGKESNLSPYAESADILADGQISPEENVQVKENIKEAAESGQLNMQSNVQSNLQSDMNSDVQLNTSKLPDMTDVMTDDANVINAKDSDGRLFATLSKAELNDFIQHLKETGFPKETLQAIADAKLSVKDVLTEISNFTAKCPDAIKENVSHQIFADKGFQTLVKNALTDQWLLTPVDVQSKDKIEALYERLNSQLSKLSEVLSGKAMTDNPLAKGVTNIQNNIEFINQINQIYSYVQLPLKMSEGKAHGDLYVYANKKGMVSGDGSVSALLHLDMEHLGPVDVYVAMQEQRVNTHFYLPDEEMLKFIEKHLYILDERLSKKGYSMNTVMSVKGDEKTAVEEIVDAGKNMAIMSQYSFDVRA